MTPEDRAWEVVRRAYEAQEPRPPRRSLRPVVTFAAALVVVAAVASPPGRALLSEFGDSVGIERTDAALFSLPARGRLLVTTSSEAWIVRDDGSRRRVGAYSDGAWSPFGRFVVLTRPGELAAIEPTGEPRWALSRRQPRLPAWGGSRTDTRIAYLAGSRLHVVAGDGTDDADAGGMAAAARVRPAWRPGGRHVLAYADTRGRVVVYDTGGAVLWRSAVLPEAVALAWTPDGRLISVGAREVRVHSPAGRLLRRRATPARVRSAAVSSSGRVALVLVDGRVVWEGRTLFAAQGVEHATWSPNGEWLLVTWPAADQWVFVRASGSRRVYAVADVAARFGGSARAVAWGPPDAEQP